MRCAAGEMGLSKDLEKRLVECYVEETRLPRSLPLNYPVGGKWFCPGCSLEVKESLPGKLQCEHCGKYLSEFIYALIERHPHLDADGKWR
jgi:hypothetical protein